MSLAVQAAADPLVLRFATVALLAVCDSLLGLEHSRAVCSDVSAFYIPTLLCSLKANDSAGGF